MEHDQRFSLAPPTNTKRHVRRVPLACVQCRLRKVRCDAEQPECKRCLADEKTCEYRKSRRGGRPRRPEAEPSQKTEVHVATSTEQHSTTSWNTTFGDMPGSSSYTPGSRSLESSTEGQYVSMEISSNLNSIHLSGMYLTQTQIDQLLCQYYTHFHAAHPCVLPKWALQSRLASEPVASDVLLPVLLYIGSIFTHAVDSGPLASAALQALISAQSLMGPPNPYYVQALLLYAIAVFWCNAPEKGRELLDKAIRGALTLGMQHVGFASQYGQGYPVLEESWRRTWWQLYLTDAHIAGSTHSFPTQTGAVVITTGLPSEETEYNSGNIPPAVPLSDYSMREFQDVEFSSFAQLIGLTQGLNQVLAMRRIGDIENAKSVAADADTMMTAWSSLLPASKRSVLREDGSVDELLFKANILMHTYVVDLHRQLSTLKYFSVETVSRCIPPPPPELNDSIKDEEHIHTAKVLFSIEKLNSLLTLPTRFSEHTPFIICMITLMTVAHLSACRYLFRDSKLSKEREKIRLNMGVLKMLGEFWPAGEREYQCIRIVAKEILSLGEEEIQIPQLAQPVPLDGLNFNYDFGINWPWNSFLNASELGYTNDLIEV